jgi:hypothetical protein
MATVSIKTAADTVNKTGKVAEETSYIDNYSSYQQKTGYRVTLGEMLLPITPSKIEYQHHSKNETFTLINGGEVNQIKDAGLTDILIDDALIPMQLYPFAHDKVHGLKYYSDMITEMKNSHKAYNFVVSRYSPDGATAWDDTRILCTVEDYKFIEDAEQYGLDVGLQLNLKEYREYGTKSLVKKKKAKKGSPKAKKNVIAKKKKRQSKKKSVPKTYKVKKGDCLILIAKKQCNNKCSWKDIYKLNKKVIEATAKKHGRKSSSNGHWIYPGTKLKLPQKKKKKK